MKNVILITLAGALIGIVVASLVVPPMLGWYAAPGGLPEGAQVQAVVNIPEVIRYATSRLILGQAIGAVIGMALGLTMWFLWRRDPSRGEPRPGADQPPVR
jgi:uncharacterized membrane protein YccC